MSVASPCTKAVEMMKSLAEKVPYYAGTAGYGFSYLHDDSFAEDQIYRLLPRYTGFEHSSDTPRDWIKGRTPAASWLTFLRTELFEQLGGADALEAEAPDALVLKVGEGSMIQAAKCPPVGDSNRGAPDLGQVPGVARFLKPLRTRIPFLRGHKVELDVDAWLSRFDDRDNSNWDNG